MTCVYKAFFTVVSFLMASFLLRFQLFYLFIYFLYSVTYYVRYECLDLFKGLELFIKLMSELQEMLAQSSDSINICNFHYLYHVVYLC